MSKIKTNRFRVPEDGKFKLKDWPTKVEPVYSSDDDYAEILAKQTEKLSGLQEVHYAAGQYAILFVFQAMDTAGKDGIIRHVMSGVNPEGCDVYSFKQPSAEELRHDFLWRTNMRLPERGKIGIFNRSYYEEVIAVRVHPELLQAQGLPKEVIEDKSIWKGRFKSIVQSEHHLHRNGTRIVKFFLHLSKEEQRQRLLARIDHPEKNWKFSSSDIKERAFWDAYQDAYEEAIGATSTDECPWYAVPADDKKTARVIVSEVVVETLQQLKLSYPKTTPEQKQQLEEFEKELRA